MALPYSTAQLQELQNAYALGVTEITFEGRTLRYASLKDLQTAITNIQANLNLQNGVQTTRQYRVYTTKGFDPPPGTGFPPT